MEPGPERYRHFAPTLDETLRFLNDAISAGKIAYYGFSNFLGWHVTKASGLAKARGWAAPATLQPQYSLLVREIELEIVPACIDAGMGLLPWSPLGGGWLSGKYKRDVAPTGATRLGEDPNRGMEAYAPRNAQERTWTIIDAVGKIAKARGVSLAQVALAWVAAQSAMTSVILGARNPEQLADNLAAASLELSTDEIATLFAVSAPADRGLSSRQGAGPSNAIEDGRRALKAACPADRYSVVVPVR
jgi:aryl-alcohol dehydrogenase-like predicted oxidoreductase